MLTERQIGQIQGLRNRGVSVSETARIVGCCRAVVRKYTDLAQSPRKEYTRPMTPKRQRRLKLLKKLSREKCSKGGRAWPRYGSAQQLQRALQAKHQIRISRRQVHEDLVELGLRSYVRPECPTRRTKDVERRRKFARKELRRPGLQPWCSQTKAGSPATKTLVGFSGPPNEARYFPESVAHDGILRVSWSGRRLGTTTGANWSFFQRSGMITG